MLVSLSDPVINNRVSQLVTLPGEAYIRTAPHRIYYCDQQTQKNYAKYYRQTSAEIAPQSLYLLDNVIVRGKGIITVDGNIVEQNIEGAPVAQIEQSLNSEPLPSKSIAEPALYLTRYGILNYGHYLTDIAPRLYWFRQLFPDIKIVIHPQTPKTILKLLTFLGFDEQKYLTIGDEPVLFHQLYFIELWNKHPLVHSEKIFAFLDEVKKNVLTSADYNKSFVRKTFFKKETWPTKIFVSRKDASTRQIVNHDEVYRFLKKQGFVEISCGALSIEDQIKYFSAAESIIGISGAAMTNMVFSNPGAKVINLSSSTMPSLYFWDLAHHKKLSYSIAYFESSNNRNPKMFSDFNVDLEVLDALLQ